MKTIRINIKSSLLIFTIVFAVSVLLNACNNGAEKKPADVKKEMPEEQEGVTAFTKAQYETSGIQLGGIERKQLSGTLKVNGLLDVPPQNQVSISLPFGGILKNTELLQGMWVNRGQVIARMEHPDYIQMQQDYLDARSQLSFMEKEYKRQEELSQENVSAAKTFERTTADYNSLKSKVQALKQKLSLINIHAENLETSGINSSIPVVSPISGYVTEVNANIGKFVQANEVLFEIVDTRHLHVELMVFEKDVPRLREGQEVRFTLANETKEREAEVHLIGREISLERTVRVHCHLKQEDKNLLPGMYLKAIIEAGASETNALPNEAIVSSGGKKYIFIQLPNEEHAGEASAENKNEQKIKEPEASRKEPATEGAEEGEDGEYTFKMVEVTTGISDRGYTEVLLPRGFDSNAKNIVHKGAYDILSKMNNIEEEEE